MQEVNIFIRKQFRFAVLFLSVVFILGNAASCSKKNAEKNILEPPSEIKYSENPVPVVHVNSGIKVPEEQRGQTSVNAAVAEKPKPDIDLTRMTATMIYSTVFQFLIDWESYEGKIIKIQGVYTPFFRQETNRIYHDVVIQDATACCKEGLEFVWDDGKHAEEEYPSSGTEIIVTGVFEQYYEDDKMEVMQIRLRDAVMEIVE